MATFYATGTGTWNSSNLSIWYMDAARTIPATAVPTSVDDIEWDNLSANITLASSYTANANNVHFASTYSGTFILNSTSSILQVYGNLELSINMTFGTTVGSIRMMNGGTTLKCNGKYMRSGFTPQPSTGHITMLDNFLSTGALGGYGLDVNGFDIYCGAYQMSGLSLWGGNTVYCNSAYSVSGSDHGSGLRLVINAIANNATANEIRNTPSITSVIINNISGYTCGWFNRQTSFTDKFEVNGYATIAPGSVTFGNLFLNGSPSLKLINFANSNTATINVTSTYSVDYVIFTNVTKGGSAMDLSAYNVGDNGGNVNITFRPQRNYYYIKGTGANISDSTAWALTSNGTSDGSKPLPQDIINFDQYSITSVGQTIIFDEVNLFKGIYTQDMLNSPTLSLPQSSNIYGSVDFTGFGSISQGTNTFLFLNEINSTMKFHPSMGRVRFHCKSPTITNTILNDCSFTQLGLVKGVLNINGKTITAGIFGNDSVSDAGATQNQKTLNMDGGKLVLTSTTPILIANAYYWTWGTEGEIELNNNSGSLVTINMGTIVNFGTFSWGKLNVNCTGNLKITDPYASTKATFNHTIKELVSIPNKTIEFYGESSTLDWRILLGSVSLGSGCTITCTNGSQKLSITTSNKNASKVLNFGNCNLTNIAAQDKNTVYTLGTITNSTQVYNQVPYLTGYTKFDKWVRSNFEDVEFNKITD